MSGVERRRRDGVACQRRNGRGRAPQCSGSGMVGARQWGDDRMDRVERHGDSGTAVVELHGGSGMAGEGRPHGGGMVRLCGGRIGMVCSQ